MSDEKDARRAMTPAEIARELSKIQQDDELQAERHVEGGLNHERSLDATTTREREEDRDV